MVALDRTPHLKARLKAAEQWLAPSTTTHILSDNLSFKFSLLGFQLFSAVRSCIARASCGVLSKSEGSIVWLVNKVGQAFTGFLQYFAKRFSRVISCLFANRIDEAYHHNSFRYLTRTAVKSIWSTFIVRWAMICRSILCAQ